MISLTSYLFGVLMSDKAVCMKNSPSYTARFYLIKLPLGRHRQSGENHQMPEYEGPKEYKLT